MGETLEINSAERTLREYLTKAKYYLYPTSAESNAIYQEKTLQFCLENGLEEEFQRLVLSDAQWRELATRKQLGFYIDVLQTDPRKKNVPKPGIHLMVFEKSNPVPVIKITATEKLF